MKKKRMKVKRYKRSFSGSADRQNTLRKVLMWIVAALVLFALGWLLAKPGLDWPPSFGTSIKTAEPLRRLPVHQPPVKHRAAQ